MILALSLSNYDLSYDDKVKFLVGFKSLQISLIWLEAKFYDFTTNNFINICGPKEKKKKTFVE